MLKRNVLFLALLISTLPIAAFAQYSDLKPAQTSNGACTPEPTPQSSQPDDASFWLPQKAKPKPDAVTAPRLIYSVAPRFPSDAPKYPFSGITKVAMLVDINGKPQQVHVEKSLGPDFDKMAIAAISEYRFRPALQYGNPVQVRICVEIDYRK